MTSQVPSYHGYRFPPAIISHAIWIYHRFGLSFRDVEDLLAQRAWSPTTPSGNGVNGLARRTRDVFGTAAVGWATHGIWMSCSSRFRVANRQQV